MVDFLLYVVDRHIHDRSDEITEQQIGVLVFGRPEGYDTNEDNIVRSYARNLRKRIEEYFSKEGTGESLLLEIPRGGYSPIFSPRSSATAQTGESPDCNPQPEVNGSPDASIPDIPSKTEVTGWPQQFMETARRHSTVFALSIGLIVGVLASLYSPKTWFKRVLASSAQAESTEFWSQLFSNKNDTFIVPSDDGLVIMQRLVERPVPLADYVNGNYRSKIHSNDNPADAEILKLGAKRYTSVVDLDLATHLAQLSQVVPERLVIRYARDLRMDDLRDGNAILIGSIEANPWIELFQPQMNFRFTINVGTDKPSGITNVHPRSGESLIYGTPDPNHTYGLIAYLPNLNATGHVLIVGGLNTAGTQAAETFLLTPSLMKSTLDRARLPGGGYQPFELLIGAGNVASNASTPQRVLERIGALGKRD